MRRNLAAVLAADVVGYSRLMGENAESTLSALRRLRAELFGPAVAGHRGKVVKSMGDGWLVTFNSAVEAVECAMQVQDRLAGDDLIKLRMGVHLGDIVHEDEDVFGDGVNVAARLQEIAEPGSVVVSDAVFGSLDGVLRPSFDDAGEQDLKNIARAVRVWARGGEIAGAGLARQNIAGFPRLSIAPVETSDERAEVRELADALTNDLVTYLGATQWLRAEATVNPEPNTYALRCVLRARGERLRLETTLTAPDGAQLWAGKHDGDLNDSFDWQDMVGADLVTNVIGQMVDRETRILDETPEEKLTAEQWMMKAIVHASMDVASFTKVLASIDSAIRLAPEWGYPYGVGVSTLFSAWANGNVDGIAPYLAKRTEWLEKVEELETGVSPTRLIAAFAKFGFEGDRTTVRSEMMAMQRHLPFNLEVLTVSGWLFLCTGDPQSALDCFDKADTIARHSPLYPTIRAGRAFAHLQMGCYVEALEEAEIANELNPSYAPALRQVAAASAHLERMEEATAALVALERLVPGDTISGIRTRAHYADTEGTRRYFEGLRLAGMPE